MQRPLQFTFIDNMQYPIKAHTSTRTAKKKMHYFNLLLFFIVIKYVQKLIIIEIAIGIGRMMQK